MLILALFAAAVPPAADTNVRTETLGSGRYRLTLEAPGIATPEAGQARLVGTAAKLCGSLAPRFGTFRWESVERQSREGPRQAVSLRLQQEISCGGTDEPARAGAVGTKPWQPSPSDLHAVLDDTRRYFAAKDGGRDQESWALLTATMQAMAPIEQWRADAARVRASIGRVTERIPVAVTWYDHPPDAQADGVFAAIDYIGEAEKSALCGYLIWLRQADGTWRLMRDEQVQIDGAGLTHSTPEQVAALRASMHCVK